MSMKEKKKTNEGRKNDFAWDTTTIFFLFEKDENVGNWIAFPIPL